MPDVLDIKLNFRNKRPLAMQIYEEMQRLVQEGALHPGSQLPTVRTLAAQLQVNFNTVARVYRVLDHEGLITTQQGRGSFVVENVPDNIETDPRPYEEDITRLVEELFEKARILRISPEEIRVAVNQRTTRRTEMKSKKNSKRSRRNQKRRFVTPAWVRELRQPGSRLNLRTNKKKGNG